MVRALELILQAKLKRLPLKGFDYTMSAAPDTKTFAPQVNYDGAYYQMRGLVTERHFAGYQNIALVN